MDEEAVAEDEAANEAPNQAMMEIPRELVPAVSESYRETARLTTLQSTGMSFVLTRGGLCPDNSAPRR